MGAKNTKSFFKRYNCKHEQLDRSNAPDTPDLACMELEDKIEEWEAITVSIAHGTNERISADVILGTVGPGLAYGVHRRKELRYLRLLIRTWPLYTTDHDAENMMDSKADTLEDRINSMEAKYTALIQ